LCVNHIGGVAGTEGATNSQWVGGGPYWEGEVTRDMLSLGITCLVLLHFQETHNPHAVLDGGGLMPLGGQEVSGKSRALWPRKP